MLTNTFSHIPGIGTKTEKALWDLGITDWRTLNDLPAGDLPPSIAGKMGIIRTSLAESARNLDKAPLYFQSRLSSADLWRLYPEYRSGAAYLDIESTGLDFDESRITTIALYDGKKIHHFVNGMNLDDFPACIERYPLLVTFNGKTFDIPFIERFFGINLSGKVHIDLRYILSSLGFRGGLKRCEKALGIDRGEVDGLDGLFAVRLWEDYKRNANPLALETLLAYNIEDVVNLEILMIIAYNLKIKGTPFESMRQLSLPTPPSLPFRPDRETVERIRNGF